MVDIVIAGIGQTPVGEHWEAGLRDLALDAISAAISDSGGLRPQALFAANMLAPNLSNQAHLGVLLAEYAGLTGIEAVTVEAAGASGGAALRQGYLAVASGMVDVALVVGVEKFTDRIGSAVDAALATTSDADFEAVQGITSAGLAALLMQRYIHEYDMPADGLAGFAVTAHANGVANPNAMFRQAIRAEAYAKAPITSEPLRQFDVAPNGDGAAALLLTRPEILGGRASQPQVQAIGSASAADTLALHDRKDMLHFGAAAASAGRALSRAGLTIEDLDLFELHDAYSIFAALTLEAVGFAARGRGWTMAADRSIALDGRIPIGTMGGLKARGFAGGATGVYQAVEATMQLQGRAGANQLPDAKVAMLQSMGGPASTVVTHVLGVRGPG